jgi:transposase
MPERGYHHLSDRDRWRIVNMVTTQRRTHADAAEALGCSTATVRRVLSRYRFSGDVTVHHSGGRQRVFTARQMGRLDHLIRENPHATAEYLQELMGPRAPELTTRTIRRYRQSLDWVRRPEPIQLADSPEQERRRRTWARRHRNDPIKSWLFMDASSLVLRHTGDLVWVKRGEPTPPHIISGLTPAVHVWGVVWDTGSVFAQYTGHLTGRAIYNLLMDNLVPYAPAVAGRTLVADGHSIQWTAEVRQLYSEAGLDALKLPPHSPRFNAIERCWAWIKQRVRRQHPANVVQLQQAMTVACQALPQADVVAYIAETQQKIREY